MIEPTRSDPSPAYQQRPFVSSNPYVCSFDAYFVCLQISVWDAFS